MPGGGLPLAGRVFFLAQIHGNHNCNVFGGLNGFKVRQVELMGRHGETSGHGLA